MRRLKKKKKKTPAEKKPIKYRFCSITKKKKKEKRKYYNSCLDSRGNIREKIYAQQHHLYALNTRLEIQRKPSPWYLTPYKKIEEKKMTRFCTHTILCRLHQNFRDCLFKITC